MKFKRFRGYMGKEMYDLRYIRNNVEDLFNTRKFYLFDRFSNLLGTKKERDGKRMAVKFFNEMIEMLVDDLIYNNIFFVLPYKGFGGISVGDVSNPESSSYRYSIETEGVYYDLKINLSEEVYLKCKRKYYGRFTRENRKKLMELVAKGHNY